MTRREIMDVAQPWAALVAGPLVWSLHQRIVADNVYFGCGRGFWIAGLGFSLLCLAVLGAASAWSWGVRRGRPHATEPDARVFLATIGVGMAAVFALAVVFGALAVLIVPECHR